MKVIPAVMVLVMREEERPNVGVVTCEDGEEGRGEEGVTLPEGEMGEEGGGGRVEGGRGALSVFLFLLGRIVVWTILRNFPTDRSISSVDP